MEIGLAPDAPLNGQVTMKHQWQDFLELRWPSRYDPIASTGSGLSWTCPNAQLVHG